MILINSNTRYFNLPGADLVFGVVADSDAERKHFQCPRFVGDGLDLASCFISINYRNANGKTDFYLVDDVVIDGDNITFSWLLSPKVTEYRGQVKFVMCAVGPDLKLKWHTTQGTGQVMEGLEPDNSHVESQTADVVAQLISMVEEQTSTVEKVGAEQVATIKSATETHRTTAVNEIEAKRANSLASIPNDYTALSGTVEKLERGKAGGIVCSAEGDVITLSDASDNYLRGLRIFGKSTQDGTPTPENPVEIVSVENPTINVNEQTVSIPRTLHGIPVTSGGNYTDANGQQWICDEVDFGRGVYVQRILQTSFDGSTDEVWFRWATNDAIKKRWSIILDNIIYPNVTTALPVALCSRYITNTANNTFLCKDGISLQESYSAAIIYDNNAAEYDVATWKASLSEKPITCQFGLKEPIETPLSETELSAYRALHTNKPNTTILNDSGAYMSVDYTADTKLYIDNKIKEALL